MADTSDKPGLIHSGLPVGDTIDFLRLIWAVDHALRRRSKSMAARLGFTGPQRLVIRIVGRFPSIHARQLAVILHLHPSSLAATLKRLERRGVIRAWRDERDGRRLLLGLTRQGRSLDREAQGTIEACVHETLKTVSPPELVAVRSVLGKLARALDSGLPPGGTTARSRTRTSTAKRRSRRLM